MRGFVPVAALCAAVALPASAAGAPQPDLQVRAVSTPSLQEAPGSRLVVSATVRNAGDKTAPASRLGLYLSRDRRKGRGDFRLRPRPLLRARKPRTRARLVRTLTVPSGARPGSFLLLACADDTRRIRERRERNNCRSAGRRIRIIARAPTGTPPAPTFPAPAPGIALPSLTVSGPPNGAVTFDTTPDYSGTARSAVAAIARIEARVDAGPFSTAGVSCSACGTPAATWTFSPPPLADGPHTISFRAIDTAGRSSPTITRSVNVDSTPPTFVSITAAPGSTAVTATFSEPLACNTVNPSDFSAEINGAPVAVQSVTCSPGNPAITLTLASAPVAGATVTVRTLPNPNVMSDPAGNVVPATTRSDTA